MSEYNSRRCHACGEIWPPHDDFETCPACEAVTQRSGWASDLPLDEARAHARQLEFERYLERREAADAKLLRTVEPFAFAQYLMDAAQEQIDRARERDELLD